MNDDKPDISLPYVEKFRPKTLDEVISHENIIATLRTYLRSDARIPHLLLYGPPGTGKTSTFEAFLHELYGEDQFHHAVMCINASERRGIEVVRSDIKSFVNTKSIARYNENSPAFKFVILDEADAMTTEAQGMLRIVIEKATKYARFCLICNCIKKINTAIQSRCKILKFSPLDDINISKKIDSIAASNNFVVTDDGKMMMAKLSRGDLRIVLHYLQVISMIYDKIDANTVAEYLKYPTFDDITEIYNILMSDLNIKSIIAVLKEKKDTKHFSLKSLLHEISGRVTIDVETGVINLEKSVYIDKKIRDIEMNIISSGDTDLQLYSIVAAFVMMKSL